MAKTNRTISAKRGKKATAQPPPKLAQVIDLAEHRNRGAAHDADAAMRERWGAVEELKRTTGVQLSLSETCMLIAMDEAYGPLTQRQLRDVHRWVPVMMASIMGARS